MQQLAITFDRPILPQPKDKVQSTLKCLIENRQLTSVELARMTSVGYPPRKIQLLEDRGIKFIHDLVDYTTTEGKKTKVARYTLTTQISDAVEIYKNMTK